MNPSNETKRFSLSSLAYRSGTAIFGALQRFPLTILFFTALASILIYRISAPYETLQNIDDVLDRVMAVLSLGVALSLSVSMLLEKLDLKHNLSIRIVTMLFELAALFAYYTFLFKVIEMVSLTRIFFTIAALLLSFLYLPYLFGRKNFEIYITEIMSRVVITSFFTVVLALGVTAIVFAIKSLLYANLNNDFYAYTWIISWFIFAPIHFLYSLPTMRDSFDIKDYSKVLKIVLTYIVLPVISVYTLVLFIYFAKIIITQVWPKGIVSYLVSSYAAVGIATVFLIWPFRNENRWIAMFTTLYTKLIFPLLVMMFIAIKIRIDQFGFTENRYFIVVIGIWATLVMIFINFNKGRNNIVFVTSLSLVLVLAVYGPVSAFSASINSQNDRFYSILAKYDMVENNQIINKNASISDDDKREIVNIISYFNRNHSFTDLKYLPADFSYQDMKSIFGFESTIPVPSIEKEYFNIFTDNAPLSISGYDVLFQFNVNTSNAADLTSGVITTEQGTFQIIVTDNVLKLMHNNIEIYSHNLETYLTALYEQYSDIGLKNENISVDDVTFFDDNAVVSVKYIYSYLYGYKDLTDNALHINSAQGYCLVKLK